MICDVRFTNPLRGMAMTLYTAGIHGQERTYRLLTGPLEMAPGTTYIVRVDTEREIAQVIGIEWPHPPLCDA